MLILTSGQVFHALKTVSLLVTASGIIGATKIRPNFKNNCNAQTKKKTPFSRKMEMTYMSKPMNKSEFGVYRNTTSRKWNTQVSCYRRFKNE